MVREPVVRRWSRTFVAVAGAGAGVVAVGSGVAAYGGWNVTASPSTFTIHAVRIPRMAAPTVRLVATGPRVGWDAVELAPGVPVDRYLVTRHPGPVGEVVCEVPGGRVSCVDTAAAAGQLSTYTVSAGFGSHWAGPDSAPSAAIRLAVAVPARSEPASPAASPEPSVSPAAVVPRADRDTPAPRPDDEPSAPQHHHEPPVDPPVPSPAESVASVPPSSQEPFPPDSE
ncbi:hypothetical protein [Actinoplanes sp. NPDC051494]|uniref:hypothetical protein n=1 Tax=Actinoplanes sp. NPDC051494 TaxID=3363907 RepID=UPI0037A56E8D